MLYLKSNIYFIKIRVYLIYYTDKFSAVSFERLTYCFPDRNNIPALRSHEIPIPK